MMNRAIPEGSDNNQLKVALLFLAVGLILYFPALSGGWLLDDYTSIVNRFDLSSLWRTLQKVFSPRGLAYLSFSLNMQFSGVDAEGYKLVNVLIHILNSSLVYALFLRLKVNQRAALILSFLFLIHPTASASVNYVVQRMTLLSCLFILCSVIFLAEYLIVSEGRKRPRIVNLFLATLFAMLSVWCKENTVLIPLLVFPLMNLFDSKKLWTKVPLIAGVVLVSAPLFAVWLRLPHGGGSLTSAGALTSANTFPKYYDSGKQFYENLDDNSNLRMRFFLAQLDVFWEYLRLTVFPVRQAFDYNWPFPDLEWTLRRVCTLLLLSATGLFAFLKRKSYPYLFLGLSWIFIFIAVESTFIVLDPMFVHRLYLPMVGVLLCCYEFLRRMNLRAWLKVTLVLILLCMLGLSLYRNYLWGDNVRLLRDNAQVVPQASRAQMMLAQELFQRGKYLESAEVVRSFAKFSPSARWFVPLGEALYFGGETAEAMAHFALADQEYGNSKYTLLFEGFIALKKNMLQYSLARRREVQSIDRESLLARYLEGEQLLKLGKRYEAAAVFAKIVDSFHRKTWTDFGFQRTYAAWAEEKRRQIVEGLRAELKARELALAGSNDVNQIGALGNRYLQLGEYQAAIDKYDRVVRLKPNLWFLYYNLGIAHSNLRQYDQAEANYRLSLDLSPHNKDVMLNLGDLYMESRAYPKAITVFEQLVAEDKENRQGWLLLSQAFKRIGDIVQARKAFTRAALLQSSDAPQHLLKQPEE